MYLVCRPLRGHFPPGSKSKPVSPRTTTVVGNTASPQVAGSQESLTLTFCLGSYMHKTFCPGSPLSFLYPSRLGQTSHLRGFPKPQAGSDLCGLPPRPQERPLALCAAPAHLLAGLPINDGSMETGTLSPYHSFTHAFTHSCECSLPAEHWGYKELSRLHLLLFHLHS